jgi:hypothetical protein
VLTVELRWIQDGQEAKRLPSNHMCGSKNKDVTVTGKYGVDNSNLVEGRQLSLCFSRCLQRLNMRIRVDPHHREQITNLVPLEAKQRDHFLYPSTQPMRCLDNLLTALHGRPTWSIENKDGCNWELEIARQAKEQRSELWICTSLGMAISKGHLALNKPRTARRRSIQ